MSEVTIAGGGNFGTAIANIIADNGHIVNLWMRDAQQVEDVRKHRENRRYLPGHPLNDLIVPTDDLAGCVGRSEVIFVTVPSASFREVARELKAFVDDERHCLVSATKGIEASTFKLMSDILAEECPAAGVGAISGPNLAEEIADHHYTATVIASRNASLCARVQELLASSYFRVYASSDTYGVELGGALKNIYAIACGMASAMGVGQNTIGLLITRSLAEMSRFAVALGANPLTFLGLAGVGDLMVTCTSPLSRNFQVGYRVAQGKSLDQAMEELGKLAEGVNTLRLVWAKSHELDLYMPLVMGLHEILFEGRSLPDVIGHLMAAQQGRDVEFVVVQ